jgi:hypothetical protein
MQAMPDLPAGSPLKPDDIDADTSAFYRSVIGTLNASAVPFLVGGGFALACFTGIRRQARDLDLFIRQGDYERAESALRRAGHVVELTFAHWLAKVHSGDRYVDLIFNSGNGVLPVDEGWFDHAPCADILGLPVRVTPAEESLVSKAFIMERERYDGADVAHLLRVHGPRMDWQRLQQRFGPHWRILLSHLVLFGFIYPAERALVPSWLMDDLLQRLRQEALDPPPATRLCAGTLLSREQYLPDIEQQGYADGRVTPFGTMTRKDVADWTAAIPRRDSE